MQVLAMGRYVEPYMKNKDYKIFICTHTIQGGGGGGGGGGREGGSMV